MSELETSYRPAAVESLHQAAWKHWLVTEPFHVGTAKFTRLDVIEALRCIRKDETAVLRAEAMQIRQRWDDLILRICEASGYSVEDGYDIAFSPYGERFMVLQWPSFRRWIPLAH